MISTWTKIDPKHNCFRFYAISLASDLFNAYVVSCEWGRMGNKINHRKVEVFSSFDEAMAQVKRIEALRLKHHYQADNF
jgi:predicted DNA-binding WGR domain protein